MARTNGRAADVEQRAPAVTTAPQLFAGPGEMRARCRAHDWTAAPLGPAVGWPAALRTAVRLMLGAPVATSLWVGPEYTLLYNDAYAGLIGAHHPAALGRPGADAWAEVWPAFAPRFAAIRAGGPPDHAEAAYIPVSRVPSGVPEDAWFTYSLSALTDEEGACLAVYNVAVEVTGRVQAERQHEAACHELTAERERLRNVLLRAPTPMALHEGPQHRYVLANDPHRGVSGGRDVTGLTLREAFPEVAGQGIYEVFDRVYATGEAWTAREAHLHYDRLGTGPEDAWFNLRYDPIRDADGQVTGILNFSVDVTDQVRARRSAEAANAQLQEQQLELELANQQLQNHARELERQAEELQATAVELAERTELAEALAERLRASEAHGRAVFAHAAVGMGRVGFEDARWLDVNDAFCRMLGYTPEELLATPWPAITHPDDLDSDLVPFRRMAAGELEAYAVEKRFVHRLGHHVWARLTLSLVRDVAGRPHYEIAVIEDITARKGAEAEREQLLAALEVERARLSDVLRQAPVAVAVARGRTVEALVYELVNPRYEEAVTPGRETVGRRVRDVLPELEDTHLAVLQGVLDTGEPFVASDYRVPLDRDADGRPEDYYFNFVYHPLVAADGQVSGLIAVSTEVTDSVRARREAEAARERTDAVLGSIADAFYLLDREWRFTHVNDAAEPLLQTTRDRLLGRTLWEAFPGVIGSVFEGPYREAMATGRVTAAEAYFPPLGTWFDVRTYPWAGGLMVHFRDIGARKTAEAERERLLADAHAARAEAEAARTRAEAASRAKSEFLAVMSHELRTPLNAIGGYAELMELGIRGPVTNEQRDDLARIQRSQRALLGLINEVLNYARLDAGAVTYDVTDVPVAEAVGAAEVLIAPQLRAKGLGYTWAGAAPGLAVRADRDKLQQVLLNLLSNAIKFTNARAGLPGRVEVSCEAVEAAGVTDATVRIQVRDTGVGIPANQLGRVFEPFVQVDQGLTRTHEGTGLGLAISRDLARGMGGDLTAESTPGAGSTFTHTLPSA